MTRIWTVMGLAAGLIASGAAFAEEPRNSPRFSMTETQNGFVRLDTQSGEVSYCREQASGLVCDVAADERTAYEAQISDLTRRLERLEAKTPAERAGVPTDEELNEAFGFFESLTKRLARAARIFGDEMQKMDKELEPNPPQNGEVPPNAS